jgi:TolA-binding protein
MKKRIFWVAIVLFALILSACASTSNSSSVTSNITSSGKASATELPTQTKLVLGTINLEETDYMVTTEQASQLLPMFYVLQELNDSSSAAQEEMDSLVDQIQEAMTKDQLQAIENMSLSMKDVFALTQGTGNNSSNASSTSGAVGGDAGGPPDIGGMTGGGLGGITGGAMPSSGNTSVSGDTSPIMDTSTPSALFDTAIELLKKKVQ